MNEPSILVRGVNWLGDAVMTLPALSRLKERFPDSPLVMLTPEKLGPLYKLFPQVDDVLSMRPGEGVFAAARKIRKVKSKLGLALPNSPRSALELWLGGVPWRVGYQSSWRSFFLTVNVPRYGKEIAMRKRSVEEIKSLNSSPLAVRTHLPAEAHQIHHYLNLAGTLGCDARPTAPNLSIPGEQMEDFCHKFHLRPGEAFFVGVNPGAEYGPAKRWPMEKFRESIRLADKQRKIHWLLFGGPGDVALCEALAEGMEPGKTTSLAGRTTLAELCAGLKLCDVVLTNDTGPMHLAAAVGAHVVALFGSTSPELTGPGWPPGKEGILKSTVPCSPCFLKNCPIDFRCMGQMTAARAAEKVVEFLK